MADTRARRLLTALASMTILTGCQTVNRYAPSAITYNLEAEKTQDVGVLLNVIRASKRRPLTFADLQTISGSNPASGSLAFTVPLAQNGSTTAATAAPTLTLGSGPTVTEGMITTQEFYQGILNPIPMSTVDLLFQRGISPDLILNLLISKIVFTSTTGHGDQATTFSIIANNYPGSDKGIGPFQKIVEAMVDAGLTTAPDDGSPKNYGPPLLDTDVTGTELAARAAAAGLSIRREGWCDLDDGQRSDLAFRLHHPLDALPLVKLSDDCKALSKEDENTTAGADAADALRSDVQESLAASHWPVAYYYQPQKPDSSASARFCLYAPREANGPETVGGMPYCTKARVVSESQAEDEVGTGRDLDVSASAAATPPTAARLVPRYKPGRNDPFCLSLFNSTLENAEKLDCSKSNWAENIQVSLVPRSVYGVLYYLGEVVRREDDPDFGSPARQIVVRSARKGGLDCSAEAPSHDCDPVFLVDRTEVLPKRGFLSAKYDGSWYAIPSAGATSKTYEVLDLVEELIALNRSAKDLPSSSVFTLTR